MTSHVGRAGFAAAETVQDEQASPRGSSRSRSRSPSRSPSRRRSTNNASTAGDEEERAFREREQLRKERERDIQRKIRMSRMGSETKSKYIARMLDRDVSEKIALGLAAPSVTKEAMFDQRLFNQSQGLSSGFKDDEGITVSIGFMQLF